MKQKTIELLEQALNEAKSSNLVGRDDLFKMIKKNNKTDYEKGYNDAILDVANRFPNDLRDPLGAQT